jgi:enoyl-CoA hydratase
MAYETILTEQQGEILVVTINREKKMNAINLKLIRELTTVFEDITDREEVKSVLLTGAGDKAFAAGADIAEFANFDPAEGEAMSRDGHDLMNSIEQSEVPVLAAVNGFALGGGCELAMACHLRVASDNAKFGQPEVNLGILPGYGGTQRLPQLVGKGRSFQMLLTGDPIDANKALEWGLVNQVTTQEALLESAKKLLGKIVRKGPEAITNVIDSVNAHYSKKHDGFETEIKHFGGSFETQDFKEGTSAFLEKRKPDFKGT